MKSRAPSGILLTLLLIGMVSMAFDIQPVKAEPGTITVPDDYPTIQEAIDAASPRDTIFVHSGIYYEHLVVNKTVSLIGENRNTTIIDGGGTGHIICVTVSNSVISGFTLRDGYNYGVHLREGTKDNIVSGNTIKRCCVGVLLDHSHGNTVSENTVENNDCGIHVEYSNGNIVNGNILTYNYHGISISYSSDNIVGGNKLTRNSHGVYFWYSNGNVVSGNIAAYNDNGINLKNSRNNAVTQNRVLKNSYGIQLYRSDDNTLRNNNIINNTNQVYATTRYINKWDDGYLSGGNYWSDYNPPDIYSGPYQNETSRDGIGDIPYIIDGNNKDRYPLIYPHGYVFSPDVNEDGIVDIEDLTICALAMWSQPGDPNWNPILDLNNDGVIDITDLVMIAIHFGETC